MGTGESLGKMARLALICYAALPEATRPQALRFQGRIRASDSGFALPLANVSVSSTCACETSSILANGDGSFELSCQAPCSQLQVAIAARQFQSATFELAAESPADLVLQPRSLPGFPASHWRFDGWVVAAQDGNVPGTNIAFLAHPSAYRTPSGRTFIISTANSHAGPGWTQGYWQDSGKVQANPLTYQLVNGSHPVLAGATAFTARMLFVDGRLLMTVGMEKSGHKVALLENKNLEDPSVPTDWVAAEGNGHLQVDFSGAPTTEHEDYRLHVFEDAPADAFGRKRKYWLLAVPGRVPNVGRACGRMAFTSEQLIGPYTYGGWFVTPNGTGPAGSPSSNCYLWPGDVVCDGPDKYFVAGWGQIYKSVRESKVLSFERLPGDTMITEPFAAPAWDDLFQIEFTFLPPAQDGRMRLYHASYANENGNPNATRADFGFKQAIGMYSFEWGSRGSRPVVV